MKNLSYLIMLLFLTSSICWSQSAEYQKVITKTELKKSNLKTNEFNLAALGQKYFDLWVLTQEPIATKEDINSYLDLLNEDVGHQHLPYDTDDSREPDGKENMRKGMLFYLGGHTEYSASLYSISTGYNVIVIKYKTISKGVHPQTKKEVISTFETIEVLEIEDEKISMIRKYSE